MGALGERAKDGPGAAATSSPTAVSPATQKSRVCGFLVTFELSDQGEFWVLRRGTLRVGRKGATEGLDIEIDHPTVSSSHGLIHVDHEGALSQIEDSQSANGTLLNGKSIAGQGRRELRDHDKIRIGGVNFIVKLL
ncbi:MAG: hypothetical protein RJA70_3726 [Pseudomonadota bacterium]